MTSAAVVICTHTERRWRDIVAAVDSVHGQQRPADEIVVVVDHNDALLARSRSHLTGVTIVDNDGPRGESGARNAGVAATTADVVAFLDDDATADPDWLAALVPWFDEDDVLGVGGAAHPRWDTERPSWFPREFDWVVGCSYVGLPEEASTIRNLMGCNMAFRRSVIDQAGGFSSALGRTGNDGNGCSETEFCIRARTAIGGRFVFEPAARIQHRVPADRTTLSYFLKRCRAEGRSKALLAAHQGADVALELERRYVRRTLPAGVVRGIRHAVREDRTGAARSAAIVAGAASTATTYVTGTIANAARAS